MISEKLRNFARGFPNKLNKNLNNYMFHIYEGFHLVETYHKMRHQRKYNPDTKRAVKIALVALVTLLL